MKKINILFVLAVFLPVIEALDCSLQPILKGVSVKQDLGATKKKILARESDCKLKCAQETEFECNAILWPGGDGVGDCYLFDKVDLKRDIFVDQRPYFLYVPVCEGEKTPSVGYCQFILSKMGVSRSNETSFVSPGSTSESSCHEFCISNYRGVDCNAFIVAGNVPSACTLYAVSPTNAPAGDQNLWTKACAAPPVNCVYSDWSDWTSCTASCGGGTRTRNRNIKTGASENGVQCVDTEKIENGICGTQECNTDCMYTEWSSFGHCNATCTMTTGSRSRTRDIARPAQSNGQKCEDSAKVEFKECSPSGDCSVPCMYSTWSAWTVCDVNCESSRIRTLEMGDAATCEVEHGPLNNTIVCDGGLCGNGVTVTIPTTTTSRTITTPPGQNGGNKTTTAGLPAEPTRTTTIKTVTVTAPNTPGCRIVNIDPSSKPSSKGYKAVGARDDCASMCRQETQFACRAFITTGPGGPCVLHGEIDRSVVQLSASKYYLQDLACTANNSTTSVCQWQMTKSGVDPKFAAPGNYDSIGMTIDAPHCGTLCSMNHPIFKPNPCKAYAWNPNIGSTAGLHVDNCFMYNTEITANITQGGEFDFYQLVCSK